MLASPTPSSQPNDQNLSTTQQVVAGLAIAGQMAFSNPAVAMSMDANTMLQRKASEITPEFISQEEHQEILAKLVSFVNMPPGHLPKDQELYVEQQLTDMLGFEITAQLDDHRLNHTIGTMGAEQHLLRSPSDTLEAHTSYLEAGIAPNRGAFGWFTENGQLTPLAIQREQYYFAVPLMYLPDWNQQYGVLKPWYKYRKMVVVNPAEQVAVVGVVGDAGPASWVKKQFGGSPEVVRQGKLWSPRSNGRVLLFFVDDPQDQVPLGPINLAWKSSSTPIPQLKPTPMLPTEPVRT